MTKRFLLPLLLLLSTPPTAWAVDESCFGPEMIPDNLFPVVVLETSKGNLSLALGLGVVLVTLALGVNAAALVISDAARRRYG